MAGPTIIENAEDAEEFLEQVDEVSRLIEGLKAGTISPEYIDTKQKHKEHKEREKRELDAKRPAGRGPPPAVTEAPAAQQKDVEDEQDAETERRERAMAKVKELMANRERKLRARARYEEYVNTQDRTQFGTDYTKWDIWCPDDEEDDLINSIGPNTPQFKAMEKDIDERHRQMVERRQLAERCRVRGNEAYKARQYSEALRCYQQGIESERTNMALHANAAMAALKISCFVQAIEHCDKVLSIADFLHNNKRDPLCVKALQRRAEAYRALQQHGKAVADLTSALEIEPGNAEAQKQLAKARQEDEEARKQRVIAKAVGRASASANGATTTGTATASGGCSGGSAAATVEAGGVVLDLDKLGRVERLAASLAPEAASAPAAAVAAATASPGGEEGAGGAAEATTDGTGRASSSGDAAPEPSSSSQPQRGPALPPRRQAKGAPCKGSGPGRGQGQADGSPGAGDASTSATGATTATARTCSELRELLRDDDACCVYLRECGGLQHLAARVIAAARPPGSSRAVPAVQASELAPLLLLLNDACMNDGNLRQLPSLKVLPAAVAVLGGGAAAAVPAGASALGSGGAEDAEAAAAAAVTLLCTAVTNEDVRREVSKLLVAGDGLARLVGLLATAKQVVQGVALALLGNCMVDRAVKSAMAAEWRRAGSPAASCFAALLCSPNAVLAEKAAVLLGNMATDTGLRAEVTAQAQAHGGDHPVKQLGRLACAGSAGSGGSGGSAAADLSLELDLRRAAATALYNMTVDEAGQRLVGEDAAGLTALYRLATAEAGSVDRTLAARAAGVCARAARSAAGSATLLGLGAVGGMLGVVTAALDGLEQGREGGNGGDGRGGGGGGADRETLAALVDAGVRILTLLTSPDDAALAAQLVEAGGVAVLLRAVAYAKAAGGVEPAGTGAGGVWESVAANGALCVGGVARRREQLGALRGADPVPVLVGVAYEGRGNAASKNAAIALARLAHDPAMLEKLRELHGIEIIYQYVKP